MTYTHRIYNYNRTVIFYRVRIVTYMVVSESAVGNQLNGILWQLAVAVGRPWGGS